MAGRTRVELPSTTTEDDQIDVERTLHRCFDRPAQPLHRDAHIRMLRTCIAGVAERFQSLNCSRPWLCYWILHAADLLGALDEVLEVRSAAQIADFIVSYCMTKDEASSDEAGDSLAAAGEGTRIGFGGGPGQIPHLAASYAAVCTLAICQDEAAVRKVDRPALQRWLVSLRSPDGGFRLHRGGEVDLRASFCAAVVAAFFALDMAVVFPAEARAYIVDSQTYEGGFCSCLDGGGEAHGGYTQCGVAAAVLLGVAVPNNNGTGRTLDLQNLERFCAMRQLDFEGGFCGRANKLVDSCYSFWIGGSAAMARACVAAAKLRRGQRVTATEAVLLDCVQFFDLRQPPPGLADVNQIDPPAAPVPPQEEGDSPSVGDFLFDQQELMHYVLQCCQQAQSGGLQDKPSAGVDFYHTCYALSGLSIASNNAAFAAADTALLRDFYARGWLPSNNTTAAMVGGEGEGGGATDEGLSAALMRSLVQPYGDIDGDYDDAAAVVGERALPRIPGPPTLKKRRAPATKAVPPPVAAAPVPSLVLRPVNPVFNVCRDKVAWMWRVFRGPTAPMALL